MFRMRARSVSMFLAVGLAAFVAPPCVSVFAEERGPVAFPQPMLISGKRANTIDIRQHGVVGNGSDVSSGLKAALRACAQPGGAAIDMRAIQALRTDSRITLPAHCTLLLGSYTWTVGGQDGVVFNTDDSIIGEGRGKTLIRYADGVSTHDG